MKTACFVVNPFLVAGKWYVTAGNLLVSADLREYRLPYTQEVRSSSLRPPTTASAVHVLLLMLGSRLLFGAGASEDALQAGVSLVACVLK